MERKFTEGTWSFYTSPQPNGCPIVGNDKGEMVCVLAHSINHEEQRKIALANARLIAAAPDLYKRLLESTDMLERILADKEWGSIEEQIIDNRAAIAKATGEQK